MKFGKVVKKLISWQWLPATTFMLMWAMTLVFRHADPATVALALLYPPRDSVGGVSLPLRRVTPLPQASGGDASLLLIQHEWDRVTRIAVLADGAPAADAVSAGATARPLPPMVPVTGHTVGSLRFLEVELPLRTLLAVLVTDVIRQRTDVTTQFSFADYTLQKAFGRSDDLVISTQNEVKGLRVFYFCIIVFAACVGLALGRMPRLTFPAGRVSPRRGRGATGEG